MSDARKKQDERCTAEQVNQQAPDFTCKLTTGHTVHIDPRTGLRWGTGSVPRGMRRRGYTKYSNRKLSRQSALAARASAKGK